MVDAVRTSHPWRLRIVIAVTAVLVAGVIYVRTRAPSSQPTAQFETAVVDHGAIRARVTATGIVNPTVQVQVGTQVSGTIQKLGADFNSPVEPGQMIAQIDPGLFQAAVELASANLLAARANTRKAEATLADAKRTATRDHDMFTQNLIAKATVDSADTAVDVAVASLAQARAAEVQGAASLATAKLNLGYTTIRSPIRGTVITRNVDVGQTVAASFASPTLFLIGEDLTKMEVDTSIAEADVGVLAPGMTATFTVDAFPGEVFRGAIRQVRSSPQVIQNVVTYNAVIDVANPKLELRPGMTANLEIVYADRTDVMRVPNAAIRYRPPATLINAATTPALGKKQVWVLRDGKPSAAEVDPGVTDGSYTEVKSGLHIGDRVITETVGGGKPSSVGRML